MCLFNLSNAILGCLRFPTIKQLLRDDKVVQPLEV